MKLLDYTELILFQNVALHSSTLSGDITIFSKNALSEKHTFSVKIQLFCVAKLLRRMSSSLCFH